MNTARLEKEWREIEKLMSINQDWVKVEKYSDRDFQISIHGRGIIKKDEKSKPDLVDFFAINILISPEYPDKSPTARISSPLFHPIISSDQLDILDGNWNVTKSTVDLVVFVWKLFSYQFDDFSKYKIKNQEALEWYKKNKAKLPLDTRDILVSNNQLALNSSNSKFSSQSDKTFKIKSIRDYVPERKTLPLEWKIYLGKQKHLIFIANDALDKVQMHAKRQVPKECFGLLLGNAYVDKDLEIEWIEILDVIPAQDTKASGASVEVSISEFSRLNEELDTLIDKNSKIRKMGWYHSHPGISIFMSGTDQRNQKNFYNKDWQVALVVDPVKKQLGFFRGADSLPCDYATVEMPIEEPEFESDGWTLRYGEDSEDKSQRDFVPTVSDRQDLLRYGYLSIATLSLVLAIVPYYYANLLLSRLGYPVIAAIAGIFASRQQRKQMQLEMAQRELFSIMRNDKISPEDKIKILEIIVEIDPSSPQAKRAQVILSNIGGDFGAELKQQ